MIVFHHDDADGRCSAAIVLKWSQRFLPIGERCIFVESAYDKPVPVDRIEQGEKVVIVDFSFKPEVMRDIRNVAGEITWCDHHHTCAQYDYVNDPELKGIRDFTDKGPSGCELTWKHFMKTPTPRFVTVLGDYDSWRLYTKPECFEFYEGLKMEKTEPWSGVWVELMEPSVSVNGGQLYDKILEHGRAAIKYRDSYCDSMIKSYGYTCLLGGHKAFAVNIYRFGSQAFGSLFAETPVCISYVHDGNKFVVSLYSATIDVAEIARKFGGGGHVGAAGFTCTTLPWIKEK